MRATISAVAIGLLVVIAWFSASSVQARQDARAAIEASNKQFAATFAKGDAAGLAAMYSSTGTAYPPNGDVVRGRDALTKLWQGPISGGIKEVRLTTTEVETHGDTAHEVGSYVMLVAGGKEADRGKYIVIWKREQGQWKLHRDIWNTSMPAPK